MMSNINARGTARPFFRGGHFRENQRDYRIDVPVQDYSFYGRQQFLKNTRSTNTGGGGGISQCYYPKREQSHQANRNSDEHYDWGQPVDGVPVPPRRQEGYRGNGRNSDVSSRGGGHQCDQQRQHREHRQVPSPDEAVSINWGAPPARQSNSPDRGHKTAHNANNPNGSHDRPSNRGRYISSPLRRNSFSHQQQRYSEQRIAASSNNGSATFPSANRGAYRGHRGNGGDGHFRGNRGGARPHRSTRSNETNKAAKSTAESGDSSAKEAGEDEAPADSNEEMSSRPSTPLSDPPSKSPLNPTNYLSPDWLQELVEETANAVLNRFRNDLLKTTKPIPYVLRGLLPDELSHLYTIIRQYFKHIQMSLNDAEVKSSYENLIDPNLYSYDDFCSYGPRFVEFLKTSGLFTANEVTMNLRLFRRYVKLHPAEVLLQQQKLIMMKITLPEEVEDDEDESSDSGSNGD